MELIELCRFLGITYKSSLMVSTIPMCSTLDLPHKSFCGNIFIFRDRKRCFISQEVGQRNLNTQPAKRMGKITVVNVIWLGSIARCKCILPLNNPNIKSSMQSQWIQFNCYQFKSYKSIPIYPSKLSIFSWKMTKFPKIAILLMNSDIHLSHPFPQHLPINWERQFAVNHHFSFFSTSKILDSTRIQTNSHIPHTYSTHTHT